MYASDIIASVGVRFLILLVLVSNQLPVSQKLQKTKQVLLTIAFQCPQLPVIRLVRRCDGYIRYRRVVSSCSHTTVNARCWAVQCGVKRSYISRWIHVDRGIIQLLCAHHVICNIIRPLSVQYMQYNPLTDLFIGLRAYKAAAAT